MPVCTFCGRSPTGDHALTACSGDPDEIASWRREVLPVCPQCHQALLDAGDAGRRFKTTGERWWLGHTVGRFGSPGALEAKCPWWVSRDSLALVRLLGREPVAPTAEASACTYASALWAGWPKPSPGRTAQHGRSNLWLDTLR